MIRVQMPFINGGEDKWEFSSGKELIHELITDDFGVPPKYLSFEAKDEQGQMVTVTIPYDDRDTVSVKIK